MAVIASEWLLSLSKHTSEAILLSVTAEAHINANLDNLCRIASLHSFKNFGLKPQKFFTRFARNDKLNPLYHFFVTLGKINYP
jgi:hypothetical protein